PPAVCVTGTLGPAEGRPGTGAGAGRPAGSGGGEGEAVGDRQAVPGVDDDDLEHQLGQLVLVEDRPGGVDDLVGHVGVADPGDRLGQRQGRPLALVEQRHLAPGRQHVEALLRLALGPQVAGVHVEAVGAPVELRGPQLDEVEERGLEVAGGAHGRVGGGERPVGGGEPLLQADAGSPAGGVAVAAGRRGGGRGGRRGRHGGDGTARSDQLLGPVSVHLIGPVEILLDVDLRAGGGRRRAIEAALRSAIRAGRLAPGTPLPSTRALASELGVARGTVVDAYDQLVAEGFLTARRGGRTVVAAGASRTGGPPAAAAPPPPRVDLSAGAPDLHAFPAQAWARAVRAVPRHRPAPPACAGRRGRPELHAALVDHLARARGVSATPGQVVVCSGVDEALGLVVRALVATGRRQVAMEDPCLSFHRRIVAGAGATVVPVPVDGDGL